MRTACPSCPDGNEWNVNGPTGRACPTCGGTAYIGEDDDDEAPWCECGAIHSADEIASNHCASCGKVIDP